MAACTVDQARLCEQGTLADATNGDVLPVATPAQVFNFLQHSAQNAIILDISRTFVNEPPALVALVKFPSKGQEECEFPLNVVNRLMDAQANLHIFVFYNPNFPAIHSRLRAVKTKIMELSPANAARSMRCVDPTLAISFPLDEPPLVSLIETSLGSIFLGNSLHAQSKNVVNSLVIDCIVNCASSTQEKPFLDIDYYDISVSKENAEESTFKAFDDAVDYLQKSFKAHRRILVHSTYGRSRCCTLVVYFLMKSESLSLMDAYHRVLNCRPQMMPRDAILDILLQKERKLYPSSDFCASDPNEAKMKLKQMSRGEFLPHQDQENHKAALKNINAKEVEQLAAKNKDNSRSFNSCSTTFNLADTVGQTKKRLVPESSVTCRWLFNRLQSGTGMLLIDGRLREDFEEDCIPTSISIPPQSSQCQIADVQNSLLPEQAHLFTPKKRKLREVVIYGHAVRPVLTQDLSSKGKPWIYVLGQLLVQEGLVSSVRYLEDGFTTFQFRYPFYTSMCLFSSLPDETFDDEAGNFLARTQSGTHNVNYPNEILDGFLYLGNMWHAQSSSVIRNLGITHIVNASLDTDNVFDEAGVRYHEVKIKDTVNADIAAHFEPTYRFIEEAKQMQHSRVLIHCTQGISRSCTLAIYYVMRAQRWSLVTSVNYCISNRGLCFPNQGFLKALMVEENKLYGGNSLSTHELDLLVGNSLSDRPVPKPTATSLEPTKSENCHLCCKVFSFFDWRHRCGICKTLVCGKCSSSRLILSEQVGERGESAGRVCDACVLHLWTIHFPLPFRMNFNIFSDKFGPKIRRSLVIKSPCLQSQTLTITYIPGTETQVLFNFLRIRFQVREYELLDVTGDGIGLDPTWNLLSSGFLNLPDNAVLFASIGESGTIPLPGRTSSLKGQANGESGGGFLGFTNTSSGISSRNHHRPILQEHSYTSRSLPSHSGRTNRRTRSFSEGRALALQESLRERERLKKREPHQFYHQSLPGTRNGSTRSNSSIKLIKSQSSSPLVSSSSMSSPTVFDEARFADLWKIAFPTCSMIPRSVLLSLKNEVLMELMLAIACLSSKATSMDAMDSAARWNILDDVCKCMNVSLATRQIMQQYIEINAGGSNVDC